MIKILVINSRGIIIECSNKTKLRKTIGKMGKDKYHFIMPYKKRTRKK